MDKLPISVIILSYNSKRWLSKVLKSLKGQKYKVSEIILVDNDSHDGSIDFVKRNHSDVVVIKNSRNLGFARANNAGAKAAKSKYLFFLNPDTQIKQKDFFKRTLSCMKNGSLDLVGPRILDFDMKDPSCGKYLGCDFFSYPGVSWKMFYIEGCALLISKKNFEFVGGFDEAYFMYLEDIDFSWRARIFGLKLGICEDAKLLHFGGGSSERTRLLENTRHKIPFFRRYEVEKNALRSIIKNYFLLNLLWVVPAFLTLNLLEALFYLATFNFKASKKILSAILWNVVNIRSTLNERNVIQKKRIVSDREIFGKMIFGSMKIKAFLKVGMPRFV